MKKEKTAAVAAAIVLPAEDIATTYLINKNIKTAWIIPSRLLKNI